MNVVVNGLMTNYQKTGTGKPVIMLHGWGDSGKTFSKLTGQLDGYTIYAPDLPGFGGSQNPPTAWSLDDYADFVSDWAQKIGIKNGYYLIGHSFGGAVAVVGAARSRLKPEKLVLLASAGIRGKKPLRKQALRLAAKAGRVPLFLLPSSRAQKIKLKLYKRVGSDFLLMPDMRETFVRTVKEDIRPKANHIKVPTLLIYGVRDNETPVQDGHALSRSIKGSRMEIIGAGHFLHQEEPEKVSRLIDNFLKSSS